MPMDPRQPGTFFVWTVGVMGVAIFLRLGWEIGGRIWAFL